MHDRPPVFTPHIANSEEPEPARLLLTGGTGFFGRAICSSSAWQGGSGTPFRLSTLARSAPTHHRGNAGGAEAEIRHLRADVTQRESLPWQHRFTHLIHAATNSTGRTSELDCFQQIIDGTRNVLELARATGVRRLLFISSGAVYGEQPADLERIPESWNGSPRIGRESSSYGLAKRAAEHFCVLYGETHGIEVIVARCFAFSGVDLPLHAHYAIGNLVRDALYRDGVVVNGDGSAIRSYLDQEDLANWLLTLLRRGRKGEVYNVGSDQAITIAELAGVIRDTLAPAKPVKILGAPSTTGAGSRYVPDIGKCARELGLRVTIPLEESIRRMGGAHSIQQAGLN